MRILLGIMLLAFAIESAAPASAHVGYLASCSDAPRSEWAKCIIDESQEQGD